MQDRWIVALVIANVSLLGLLAVVGSIVMPTPPTWFQSLAFACLTWLAGYLTQSPITPKSPTEASGSSAAH